MAHLPLPHVTASFTCLEKTPHTVMLALVGAVVSKVVMIVVKIVVLMMFLLLVANAAVLAWRHIIFIAIIFVIFYNLSCLLSFLTAVQFFFSVCASK